MLLIIFKLVRLSLSVICWPMGYCLENVEVLQRMICHCFHAIEVLCRVMQENMPTTENFPISRFMVECQVFQHNQLLHALINTF
jgi:hypothetical protein